jgi:glycosyltransferase involved in cell wall biosynthesis
VPLTSADRNVVQGCCPLKLLEALSAGCPVIASDLPVVRELAANGEHLLTVPPDDPAALALALWNVARDPGAAICRARAGRRRVEALSWRSSTDRLLAVYDDMLASRA